MEPETNEELAQKISALLQSPDSMEKIRNAMSAFGLSSDEMASAAVTEKEPARSASPLPAQGVDVGALGALTGVLPLLKNMQADDQNTALLRSLRPYLHGEREKKLDDAIKMMQWMKVIPLLREKGLF